MVTVIRQGPRTGRYRGPTDG